MRRITIISITEEGDGILKQIENFNEFEYAVFPCNLSRKIKLSDIVQKEFLKTDAIVFIMSLGICVRVMAPFLVSKRTDPAILCIPNNGAYVISVAGGHLGGANKLAESIARQIGAVAIITTATDLMGIKAPDLIAKENNLVIESMEQCKKISVLLIAKKRVALIDEKNIINENCYVNYNGNTEYDGIVSVTNRIPKKYNARVQLNLIRKNIVIGIGCKKGFDPEIMLQNTKNTFLEEGIDYRAVSAVVTVGIKKDEPAILKLAEKLAAKLYIFSTEEIKRVEHNFESSEFVKKAIGVGCVAEPCVVLHNAKLIKKKKKINGMTIAIGELEI